MRQRSFPGLRFVPHLALALLGFTIVLAVRSAPPGPRVARLSTLVDLIAREDARSHRLRDQLEALQRDWETLQVHMGAREERLTVIERQIEMLGRVVGLSAADGTGVLIEMRDSTLRTSPSGDLNDLVIHEQDLQAVVNALWSAGAEAISINGERLTSVSAVRCVGNTLLLHGSVYSPPYRISAIGDPPSLIAGLDADSLVRRFRIFVEDYRLGFDVRAQSRVSVPAYTGVVSTDLAKLS